MMEPEYPRTPNTAPFSLREAALAGLIMLAVNFLGGGLFTLLDWSNEYRDLAENLSVQVGLLLGVIVILFRRRLSWSEAFGLKARLLPRSLAIGLIGCAILVPVTFLLHALAQALLAKFGLPAEDQPAIQWLLNNPDPLFRAILFAQAVVVAPVCEELFFRGLLLNALHNHHTTPWAIALSALLFAAFHFNLPATLPLFAIASGFALAYLYSRSLTAAIVMHAAYNLVNFAWVLLRPPT